MQTIYKSKYQSGQSLAEFLVGVGLIIVPLFFGMTYLSKVGEASNKTHNAARYGAWERTIYHPTRSQGYNPKANNVIAVEANNRIFSESAAGLDTRQDRVLVDYNNMQLDSMARLYEKDYHDLPIYGQRSFTGNNNGGGNNGNTPRAIVNLGMSQGRHPGSLTSRVNSFGRIFGFNGDNFFTANAQTPLVKSQYLRPADATQASSYDNMIARADSVNAIYTGSWNARGPSDAESRVRRVLPSSFLSGMNGILNTLGNLGLRDFRGRALQFGKVDADRVPCQRVAGNIDDSNC